MKAIKVRFQDAQPTRKFIILLIGSSTSCVVDRSWDKQSVISRETFETAQEPPSALLLALGLSPPALPTSDDLSLAESSADFEDESRNEGPRRKGHSFDGH